MEDWLHPLLRALHYTLILGLFGATAFPWIGLRGFERPRYGVAITSAAALAPVVSLALMLVGIAAMMGQSVSALERTTIGAMVTSTSMGAAFGLRLALLVAAAAALRSRTPLAAMFYGFALATLPWSGHAAASVGAAGVLHRFSDWIHLLAGGLWFGAIGWFTWLVARAHRADRSNLPLLTAMHSFAPIGIALAGIVAVSGLLNAQLTFGLANSAAVAASAYGLLLAGKLVLVGLMLLCASRHSALVRRAVIENAGANCDHGATLTAARTSLRTELALGLVVIGTVAALGLLSPLPQ